MTDHEEPVRIIIGLLSPVELDGCDCAVIELDATWLRWAEKRAELLLTIHAFDGSIYKLEFWGNTMDVYSYKLKKALEDHDLDLMYTFFGENGQPQVIPKDFQLPEPEEDDPQRLDLRMTKVSQPDCWSDPNKVEFQFTACAKHTDVDLQTHPITLAQVKEWLKS